MVNIKFKRTIYLAIFIIITFTSYLGYRNQRNKVLLICLDGASWNVIIPLMQEHRLPNIERLIKNGCSGGLESIPPFFSEVIWTSIATGKAPGVHGITERLVEDKEAGGLVLPTSNLRKAKAIWNILSERGYNVGVINYMVTWPPERVNGVMVSDRITDAKDLDYSSRSSSRPVFTKLLPKREFNDFKNKKGSILSGITIRGIPHFWSEIEGVDNFMFNLSGYLLKKRNFDFFCLYLRGVDVVSHALWKFRFHGNFDIPESDIQKYRNTLESYYILCDKMIGDIVRICPRNTITVVVSDHGFTSQPDSFFFFDKVNFLLDVSGISQVKSSTQTVRLINDPEDKYSFFKNIKIMGNLSEMDFNKIREGAKNILKNIRVIETGEHPFGKFKDTKNGFIINLRDTLDLSLGSKLRYYHIMIDSKEYNFKDFITDGGLSGIHSNQGIIIISGRHILRNKKLTLATVYDIFPTILYYIGLPVPQDITGNFLSESVEKIYLKINPIKYIDTYETGKNERSKKPIRNLLNEEKIKDKMRSLGYINQ